MIFKNYIFIITLLFIIFLPSYCYYNTQTTTGDYSPNIINSGILVYNVPQLTKEHMQHLSIQYMRAFDSSKVPLFMKYVISKNINSTQINASKEFQEFWHEKWKSHYYPLQMILTGII